jgi:hypothetical protein
MYGGLTPAVIASAVSWGGYFFFYENAKQRRLEAMDRSKVHRRETLIPACTRDVHTTAHFFQC